MYGHLLFSVLFAMTYIHVNKITPKNWVKDSSWPIILIFHFLYRSKPHVPMILQKNISYCRNSTWMHFNTSKYAVWIQLRVFYSVNNIRYTSMQRFEKKMKIKTLNHVSRDFASSPSRKFRTPSTIYVGVTYISISVLHDSYILKIKN